MDPSCQGGGQKPTLFFSELEPEQWRTPGSEVRKLSHIVGDYYIPPRFLRARQFPTTGGGCMAHCSAVRSEATNDQAARGGR